MSSYRRLECLHNWEKVGRKPEVWADIKGHVKRPGKYKLRPGENLGSALRKAAPKPFADLSCIDGSAIPQADRQIEILALQKIRVRVTGCVKEELSLELKPGCRISDLRGRVALSGDAEPKFLKKRRLLKDGETVEIPQRATS